MSESASVRAMSLASLASYHVEIENSDAEAEVIFVEHPFKLFIQQL